MPHRIIVRRVGLRGEALLGLGIVWILMGVGVSAGLHQPREASGLWHLLLPDGMRAGIWLATGAIAIIAAKWQHLSPTALALLTVAPMIRVTSYLWSWLMALIPGPPSGNFDAWYGCLTQLALLGAVLFVAHVPMMTTDDHAEQVLRDRLGRGAER